MSKPFRDASSKAGLGMALPAPFAAFRLPRFNEAGPPTGEGYYGTRTVARYGRLWRSSGPNPWLP